MLVQRSLILVLWNIAQTKEESRGWVCSQGTPHYTCVREAEAWRGNQREIQKRFLDTQGRIRKAKEQLEWKLLKDIKSNRKGFYSHSSNKRETRENMGLQPSLVGDQVMERM